MVTVDRHLGFGGGGGEGGHKSHNPSASLEGGGDVGSQSANTVLCTSIGTYILVRKCDRMGLIARFNVNKGKCIYCGTNFMAY